MSRFELRHGAYTFAKTDLSKCNIVISIEGLQRKIVKIDGKITFFGADFTYIWNLWTGGMYEIDNVQLYDNNVLKAVCTLIIDSDLDNYRKLGNGTLSVNSPYDALKRAYETEYNWLEMSDVEASPMEFTSQTGYVIKRNFSIDIPETNTITLDIPEYNSTRKYIRFNNGDYEFLTNLADSRMFVKKLISGEWYYYICKSYEEISGIEPPNSDYWQPLPMFPVFIPPICAEYQYITARYDNTWIETTLNTPTEALVYRKNTTPTTVSINYRIRDLRKVINFYCQKNGLTSFPYIAHPEIYALIRLTAFNMKLMLMDKSDAKRPNATEPATRNFMTLKTLLDELWNQFEIDWFINSDGLFSLVQKYDYYQNLTTGGIDLTPYTAGLTTFDFEPNRIVMEIWNFEKSTNDWNQLIYDYPVTGENKREINLNSVCNNITFLGTNPSTISDNGRTWVAVFESDNKIFIDEGVVNGICAPAGLNRVFLETLRPRIATKNNTYTFDSVDFDKLHAEIKIPHGIDIFSIDFFSFAKTTLSDKSLIYEASQSLKDGSIKIKCKFFELK